MENLSGQTAGEIIVIFFMLIVCSLFYFMSYNWENNLIKPFWSIDSIPFYMLKSSCFLMTSYKLYGKEKPLRLFVLFYLLMSMIIFSTFIFYICHNVNSSIIGFILVLTISGIMLSQLSNNMFTCLTSLSVFILTIYEIIYLYSIKELNGDIFQNI